MAEDFYTILGLHWNASADQINQAYRSLALQYHPDVNREPGAEEKFQAIQKAFEALSDPKKRAAYDRTRQREVLTRKKAVACPPGNEPRIYKLGRLAYTSSSGVDDMEKLGLAGIVCVFLMIVASAVVSLIALDYYNTPAPLNLTDFSHRKSDNPTIKISPIIGIAKAAKTTAGCVTTPFLILLLCITSGYLATHRDSKAEKQLVGGMLTCILIMIAMALAFSLGEFSGAYICIVIFSIVFIAYLGLVIYSMIRLR